MHAETIEVPGTIEGLMSVSVEYLIQKTTL